MKLPLTFLLVFQTTYLSAQTMGKNTVGSAGLTFANPEVEISFTIGEPVVGLIANDVGSLDHGFWAGSLTVEPITEEKGLGGITVYPNPVIDELNIYANNHEIFGINLFAVDGKMALKQKVEAALSEHKINLGHLAKGMYVLRLLVQGSSEEKLFKIIKK